ncbi:Adenosylcobinamide-GDP ribazoletransferase [Streptomyces sp. RB5]|uniref:Adenosylcobinamide-GDP ribazoletransferase n=1 Tax=Streptomyces smaragdinus TaxID=2585196 RepID=A0A7K0CPB8_9ACTN|nr:adenosylcobinamide-GDP ribazoletransferase [Streptomyces smaragdinus]MQY15336.1 Adenosylcobinamide-GDP ribazoletransferase [Streptomyces smaragdinus]
MIPDALRFAFGTLTALPVTVRRWDRPAARDGMRAAPAVGVVLGLCAAGAGGLLSAAGAGPLLAAVAAVAVPAALTRGLHLDGLADTADGLGSGKPPEAALAVMRQSDIGPFGVVTLTLTLLAQVAAVTELYGTRGWAFTTPALTASAVTARASLTLACRPSVPPSRPEGLGAAVAGTVPTPWAYGIATTCAAAVAAVTWPLSGPGDALRLTAACAAGLIASTLLLRHCVRRLRGITGDVFGALAETAATAALVTATLG